MNKKYKFGSWQMDAWYYTMWVCFILSALFGIVGAIQAYV